jgi:hypothetical protein
MSRERRGMNRLITNAWPWLCHFFYFEGYSSWNLKRTQLNLFSTPKRPKRYRLLGDTKSRSLLIYLCPIQIILHSKLTRSCPIRSQYKDRIRCPRPIRSPYSSCIRVRILEILTVAKMLWLCFYINSIPLVYLRTPKKSLLRYMEKIKTV